MLIACLKRAITLDNDRQRNLATHIVNQLGKGMRRA